MSEIVALSPPGLAAAYARLAECVASRRREAAELNRIWRETYDAIAQSERSGERAVLEWSAEAQRILEGEAESRTTERDGALYSADGWSVELRLPGQIGYDAVIARCGSERVITPRGEAERQGWPVVREARVGDLGEYVEVGA